MRKQLAMAVIAVGCLSSNAFASLLSGGNQNTPLVGNYATATITNPSALPPFVGVVNATATALSYNPFSATYNVAVGGAGPVPNVHQLNETLTNQTGGGVDRVSFTVAGGGANIDIAATLAQAAPATWTASANGTILTYVKSGAPLANNASQPGFTLIVNVPNVAGSFNITVQATPEPGTMALASVGLAGLIPVVRRRFGKKAVVA